MTFPFTVTYSFEPGDLISAARMHAKRIAVRWPFLVYMVIVLAIAFLAIGWITGDKLSNGIIPFLIGATGTLTILMLLSFFVFIPMAERRQFRQNAGIGGEQTATFDEEEFSLSGPKGTSNYRWDEFHRWAENSDHLIFYLTSRMYFVVPKRAMAEDQIIDVRDAIEKSGLKRF